MKITNALLTLAGISFFGLLIPLSPSLAGIVVKDPDGQFEGEFRFRMQNLAEFGENTKTWQVRRLRLRSKGWVHDPKIQYSLQLSFSRSDMDWDNTRFPNIVRDATVSYVPDWWGSVAFGQTKLAGNRQRIISSGQQQFADRSVVNRTFNLDRDFGFFLQLNSDRDETLRLKLNLTTGEGRNLPNGPTSGLAQVSKIEWSPFGPFKDDGEMFEGDLKFEPTIKSVFGFSYGHFRGSNRQGGAIGRFLIDNAGSPFRRNIDILFADALFKWNGWALYLEGVRRWVTDPVLTPELAYYPGQGYLIQASRMVSEKDEVAFRFGHTAPSTDVRAVNDPNVTQFSQTTFGYTHYFHGHRVKVQVDTTYEQQRFYFNQNLQVGWSGRFNVELGI